MRTSSGPRIRKSTLVARPYLLAVGCTGGLTSATAAPLADPDSRVELAGSAVAEIAPEELPALRRDERRVPSRSRSNRGSRGRDEVLGFAGGDGSAAQRHPRWRLLRDWVNQGALLSLVAVPIAIGVRALAERSIFRSASRPVARGYV
jgi:hypothetical protein